jgi:hypothetical protein
MLIVKNRIDAVEALSNNLREACSTLATRVAHADSNMKSFVDKASQLENDRMLLLNQSKEIQDFLAQFHLADEEVDLLTAAKLDHASQAKAFFAVLSKVKTAYADCKVRVF